MCILHFSSVFRFFTSLCGSFPSVITLFHYPSLSSRYSLHPASVVSSSPLHIYFFTSSSRILFIHPLPHFVVLSSSSFPSSTPCCLADITYSLAQLLLFVYIRGFKSFSYSPKINTKTNIIYLILIFIFVSPALLSGLFLVLCPPSTFSHSLILVHLLTFPLCL